MCIHIVLVCSFLFLARLFIYLFVYLLCCIFPVLLMNMVRAQFTVEQRSFMVSRYLRTNSVARTIHLFSLRFPNARVPHRHTILKNVTKYQLHGTSHNRNRTASGRPRSVRTQRNIANVQHAINHNPRVSARRNPLANISSSSFNRITRFTYASL